jgi:cytochrome P450
MGKMGRMASSRSAAVKNARGLRHAAVKADATSSSCWTTHQCRAPSMHKQTAIRYKSAASAAVNATAAKKLQSKSEPEIVMPTLVTLPMLPIIGSLVPQYSGVPPNIMDPYQFWVALRRKFGGFIKMGLPNFGRCDDLFRSIYIISDPKEMMKVIRSGGSYPSGIIEVLWANKKWQKTRGFKTEEFFGRGETWKRVRTFLQTDLLHPDSARGYVPGILEAARLASKGAPSSKNAMNDYLSRCAFDMFSSLMFGEMTQVADLNTPTNQENQRFVECAADGLGKAVFMAVDPKESILGGVFGIETKMGKQAFAQIDEAWAIAGRKFDVFRQEKEAGTLNKYQQASYLSRALIRQEQDGSNITLEEAREICFTQLFAAVDTTSSAVGWNLLHIARLPKVQQRLYEELSAAVQTVGSEDGELTGEVLDKAHCPYFHAVFRETIRLTPLGCIFVNKVVGTDTLQIHGEALTKGDVVVLEGYGLMMDPAFVDDPQAFRPERWLEPAVQARKDTPQEVIDHPFFRGPFSQGARRCPGSRVAASEMQIMVAQLLLDWNMSVPNIKEWEEVSYQQLATIEVHLPEFEFEARS